jgi:hypothetical protein
MGKFCVLLVHHHMNIFHLVEQHVKYGFNLGYARGFVDWEQTLVSVLEVVYFSINLQYV